MNIEAVLGLWQDRPAAEATSTAKIADELGLARIWIGEMATYDAFALAVSVASGTDRIEPVVGPLAVSVRSPVGIAMGVASISSLTGRRAHLALGTSSPVVVERWHGRSREGSAAALRSTAHAVRTLLAGDREPSSGFRLRLPPVFSDIAIAAFGSRAVSAAAAHADVMLLNMVTPAAVAQFRSQLDAAGGSHVPIAAWLVGAVEPTPEEIAQIHGALVGYLGAPGYGEMFADAGFGDLVGLARSGAHPREILGAIPDDLAPAVGLVGSETRIGELLEQYEEAGLDTACVVPVTGRGDLGRTALETVSSLSGASAAG
ncbi:MAG: LLM class F420-dependent oxidoreductase [Acidimicrobiia bacterium]|nr:LLM class F420-dependent oxidoreductase [Acidimicrobiia bacterium]